MSSYTDPPTSAQMCELAREVASIRTAIDRLVRAVDDLPLFGLSIVLPLASVIFFAGIVSLARGR